MKRAVIFDFGGVLMKTLDYSYRHQWDDRLGLPGNTVEKLVHGSESWRQAQLGSLSMEDYWQDVAEQLKLSPQELTQLQADYFKGDRLDSNLIGYIRELRARGHRVALLSNDSAALHQKLERLDILDLFDPLIISANIGFMKPAPEAYLAMLHALQLPPEQTVFIDDMPYNIIGAQAVGIHAIQYTPDLDLREILESLLRSE
jgi:epoxide hydrolase-like predicted phosphatase